MYFKSVHHIEDIIIYSFLFTLAPTPLQSQTPQLSKIRQTALSSGKVDDCSQTKKTTQVKPFSNKKTCLKFGKQSWQEGSILSQLRRYNGLTLIAISYVISIWDFLSS